MKEEIEEINKKLNEIQLKQVFIIKLLKRKDKFLTPENRVRSKVTLKK